MLEYLRNASEKPVAKILITILAFSFVGWGVAEWVFGNVMGDSTVMTVGDAEISAQQLSAERTRQLGQMSREQQRAIYGDDASAAAFTQQIMTTLATQQMAENRASDLGFVVSDNRIAREIRQFPEFQLNGQFSTLMFDRVLAASGLSEAGFAAYLRSQILRSMTLGAVSVPLSVPDFVVNATYSARNAQRKIEFVPVKFSDFKVSKPTDDALREYYAQHPQTVPEARDVSYVLVSASMDKPDSYDAGFVTAQKVEDDIIAGESLNAAASKNGAKFATVKNIGANYAGDDVLDVARVAKIFAMDEGAESELIETPKGFLLMRVDAVHPAHMAEFDAVKSSLVSGWTHDEQKKQAYVRANELLVDLNKDGKLTGANNATVTRTTGAAAPVLVASFNNPVGTNTIVVADDAYYVLAVRDSVTPKGAAKTDALRTELSNTLNRMLQEDYNAFLVREYPVKVNEKVFNRFFAK